MANNRKIYSVVLGTLIALLSIFSFSCKTSEHCPAYEQISLAVVSSIQN